MPESKFSNVKEAPLIIHHTFGKHERLLKRAQFDCVLDRGKRRRLENLCTVFSLPNGLGHHRLGIIASRRVGNACIRNRVKRKIRESFRLIKSRIAPPMDIVIIAGKGLIPVSFSVFMTKLERTLPVKPRNQEPGSNRKGSSTVS